MYYGSLVYVVLVLGGSAGPIVLKKAELETGAAVEGEFHSPVALKGAGLEPVEEALSELLASVEVYWGGTTVYVSTEHQDSGEVVFLQSLDEAEISASPGPFSVIRVADFLATAVQEQVLDSYYGTTACSDACGTDGLMMDVTSCLSCIALSKAHLKPFPVVRQ